MLLADARSVTPEGPVNLAVSILPYSPGNSVTIGLRNVVKQVVVMDHGKSDVQWAQRRLDRAQVLNGANQTWQAQLEFGKLLLGVNLSVPDLPVRSDENIPVVTRPEPLGRLDFLVEWRGPGPQM